jgi:hypothetical protein
VRQEAKRECAAEEACKAEEAKWARQAEVARAAKEKADKEEAERAVKIWAVQETLKEGILAIEADKKNAAEKTA